jgi:hypothetical protein
MSGQTAQRRLVAPLKAVSSRTAMVLETHRNPCVLPIQATESPASGRISTAC